MESKLNSDLDALNLFYNEEIRGSINVVDHYLNFLFDNEKVEISGDSLYVEKKGDNIVIGNLFDEEFSPVAIKYDIFIDFLKKSKEIIQQKG